MFGALYRITDKTAYRDYCLFLYKDFSENELNESAQYKKLINDTLLLSTHGCLLYTSDAADERSSVDLGGRRIIKKKKWEKKKRKKKNNTTQTNKKHTLHKYKLDKSENRRSTTYTPANRYQKKRP